VQLLKHDAFFETSYDGTDQLKNLGTIGATRLCIYEWRLNTFEAEVILLHSFTVPLYVFLLYSYTGEALDNKPLLRALSAIDEAATDVCKYFDKNVKEGYNYIG
jgi:glutamine synthetase